MRLFMAMALLIPVSSFAQLSGVYQFSEIKCATGVLPPQPSENKFLLTFSPDSQGFTFEGEFLGYIGGRCTGQAFGVYQESRNRLTLQTEDSKVQGELTSVCRTVLEVVNGSFEIAGDGLVLKSTGARGGCANATINLQPLPAGRARAAR